MGAGASECASARVGGRGANCEGGAQTCVSRTKVQLPRFVPASLFLEPRITASPRSSADELKIAEGCANVSFLS
jgi:hypothetical protein